MTTASWVGFLDHTNDAGFRAWASELSTQLAAIGLVQTGDTGQINLVTVTRPGTNTAGGYQIWRFADSSLYLKLEYGTNTGAAVPQMWLTVGTGSNGSGTITGQTSTRSVLCSPAAVASTVTNYTSRICRVADAFSLSWKEAYAGAATVCCVLVIGKTVDGAGAATTTGFAVLRSGAATGTQVTIQSVRTAATATTYTDDGKAMSFPGDPASSAVQSGNLQAYQIPINVPEVVPFAWAVSVLTAEVVRGTTFSVAMVGAVSHTYVGVGQANAIVYGGGYTAAGHSVAIIFE